VPGWIGVLHGHIIDGLHLSNSLRPVSKCFLDPAPRERVERRIRIPGGAGPSPDRRRTLRGIGSATDVGDGKSAAERRQLGLFEPRASIKPTLKGFEPRCMTAVFERPAQSGQVGRERLRRNAIPVRVLHAVGVHREALELIRGRNELAAAQLIEQRLAPVGSAIDDQPTSLAALHRKE